MQILFEETHYDSNEKSYRVLCLEKALEGGICKFIFQVYDSCSNNILQYINRNDNYAK